MVFPHINRPIEKMTKEQLKSALHYAASQYRAQVKATADMLERIDAARVSSMQKGYSR